MDKKKKNLDFKNFLKNNKKLKRPKKDEIQKIQNSEPDFVRKIFPSLSIRNL